MTPRPRPRDRPRPRARERARTSPPTRRTSRRWTTRPTTRTARVWARRSRPRHATARPTSTPSRPPIRAPAPPPPAAPGPRTSAPRAPAARSAPAAPGPRTSAPPAPAARSAPAAPGPRTSAPPAPAARPPRAAAAPRTSAPPAPAARDRREGRRRFGAARRGRAWHPPGAVTPRASDPLRFDAAYFRRYYHGRDRTHSAREIASLVAGVCGLSAWLGVRIGAVLDVGAGTGIWRAPLRRRLPDARYRSVDVSPYACARYGHEQRDISRWRARERFDLVVCHSVLQYLPDAAAERALRNLGAMCRGILYLEAITREDLEVLDLERTDTVMHLRPARWYRARLAHDFEPIGGGLWAARRGPVRLYALERGR